MDVNFESILRQMRELQIDFRQPERVKVTPEFWQALKASVECSLVADSSGLDRAVFGLPVEIDPSISSDPGFEIVSRK